MEGDYMIEPGHLTGDNPINFVGPEKIILFFLIYLEPRGINCRQYKQLAFLLRGRGIKKCFIVFRI